MSRWALISVLLFVSTLFSASIARAAQGKVPEGMLLGMTVPVSDDPDADNIGAPRAVLAELYAKTGCNSDGLKYTWAECEPTDPGRGRSRYVWPDRSGDPFIKIRGLTRMVSFNLTPPAWASDLKGSDRDRYWKLVEGFVTAASRNAREEFNARYFHVPGNEPSLTCVAKNPIYKPEYDNWYEWYMDTALHVSKAIKADHPGNQVVIGALVVGDEARVGALYTAGAKGHFDVMDIHAYGDEKQHVSMKQIIETHEAMAKRGDGDKKIYLGEGWSCFPLPKRLDGNLDKEATYTQEDVDHYWETIQVGWMNLITPRPGEYDPKWVLGARYFTFCDLIEGRGWRKRAIPQYGDDGKIIEYMVDGYAKKENELGPFFRPWGIVDVKGNPKGNLVESFPPYIPKYKFGARLGRGTRGATRTHTVAMTFRNMDTDEMRDLRFSVYGRMDGGRGRKFDVTIELVGKAPPQTLSNRKGVAVQYNVTLPDKLPKAEEGDGKSVRLYGECRYRWDGMPYYADAWGPIVRVP